ncbi:MAG: FAD-dependent oxidoreductase [Candidatus Limnocylindrales bacterium]
MDVCVVGAGIIGASTAYYLARGGASVTVFDMYDQPSGASAATFGWVNANGKSPDHYFELNRAGMEANAELARTLGGGTWLHGGGSLEWVDADGSAGLHERVESLAARGYPAELVDAARLRELEPALQPMSQMDGGTGAAAYFPSEGWVDSVALIHELLASAAHIGARVRRGVRVTALERGRATTTVVLDGSDSVAADVVVNCAGADAGTIAAYAGLAMGTIGPVGLNAVTAPLSSSVTRVVRAPGVHFRPERDGRLMIASPAADAALARGADPADLASGLIEAAARHLPTVAAASVDEARVARRAIPTDGLPVLGCHPDAPWLYHVVTHSGVTLAPLLGRLAAAEIVTGAEEERLSAYRPTRFVGSIT